MRVSDLGGCLARFLPLQDRVSAAGQQKVDEQMDEQKMDEQKTDEQNMDQQKMDQQKDLPCRHGLQHLPHRRFTRHGCAHAHGKARAISVCMCVRMHMYTV